MMLSRAEAVEKILAAIVHRVGPGASGGVAEILECRLCLSRWLKGDAPRHTQGVYRCPMLDLPAAFDPHAKIPFDEIALGKRRYNEGGIFTGYYDIGPWVGVSLRGLYEAAKAGERLPDGFVLLWGRPFGVVDPSRVEWPEAFAEWLK